MKLGKVFEHSQTIDELETHFDKLKLVLLL